MANELPAGARTNIGEDNADFLRSPFDSHSSPIGTLTPTRDQIATPEFVDPCIFVTETEPPFHEAAKVRTKAARRIGCLVSHGKELKSALAEDWQSNDNRSAQIGSWVGYAVTKTMGRLQLPAIGIAYSSMEILSRTNSSVLTALGATALSIGWSRFAAGTMNNAINHHPNAYKAVGDRMPRVNQTYADTLPGLGAYTESGLEKNSQQSLQRRLINRLRRGIVANNRLTPYLSAAGREGQTPIQRKKLASALSLDAGVVRGAAFGCIAISILEISQHNAELAEQMQGVVRHPLSWHAFGALIMAHEFAKNRKNKKAESPAANY